MAVSFRECERLLQQAEALVTTSTEPSVQECRDFLMQAGTLLPTSDEELLAASVSFLEEAEKLLQSDQSSWVSECRDFLARAERLLSSTRPSLPDYRDFLDKAEQTVLEHWHRQIGQLQACDPRKRPDFQAINLLEIFGISRREAPHSRFIGWLLDPRGSHGLGATFLKSFLRTAQEACGCEFEGDLDDVKVELERSTDKGVPDITVIGSNFLCMVENKIRSAEGQDQAQRYADAAEAEAQRRGIPRGHLLLAFLTPTGRQPKDRRFHALAYSTLLKQLESLLDRDVSPIVELAVKQFVFNLRARVLHEYDQDTAVVRHLEGYEERGEPYLRKHWQEITRLARNLGGKQYD